MNGLTRTQNALLRFIGQYITEHGYSPSYDEMAVGIGGASKGNIHRLVQCLLDRDAVTRLPGQSRSITVTGGFRTESVLLPPDLDAEVRALARKANTTPAAIIIECVRDRLSPLRSISVSRGTSQSISGAA